MRGTIKANSTMPSHNNYCYCNADATSEGHLEILETDDIKLSEIPVNQVMSTIDDMYLY